jgi:hypothetical protein
MSANGEVTRKWTGKSSLNKGKRGERDVVTVLNPVIARACAKHGMGIPGAPPVWALGRNLQQTQIGGFDIDGVNQASREGLAWLAIEVKHHAELKGQIDGWWRQAVVQAEGGNRRRLKRFEKVSDAENGMHVHSPVDRQPILIYRGNGIKWRVRMLALITIGDVIEEPFGGGIRPKRRLKVVADISMVDFLLWFEKRVDYELTLRRLMMDGREE